MTHTARSNTTLLALTMITALFIATPPWAAGIELPLTGGGVTVLISSNGSVIGSVMGATGPDFSVGANSLPFGWAYPFCLEPCVAGSTYSANTGGDFASGGGVTYQGVSVPISDAQVAGWATASWHVTANPIVMPAIGDSFTVTEPFLITVSVGFPVCTDDPTCWLQKFQIHGSGAGIATLTFAPLSYDPDAWGITSAVYNIQTPEPGTWFLLATGALACMSQLVSKKRRATARPG